MSWFTIIKSDMDAFLGRAGAPREAEVIAAFRGVLPVLNVALPLIEVAAGVSANARAVATQVVVTAQAVITRLSDTPAVADVDSAFAAISALATVLPAGVEPEVLAAIGFAQAVYAQFKAGILVPAATLPVAAGPGVVLSDTGTVTASA